MTMIRVAICDDEAAVREQLCVKVHEIIDKVDIMQFADGNEFLASHEECPFDIVLLDIDMPVISGLEVA